MLRSSSKRRPPRAAAAPYRAHKMRTTGRTQEPVTALSNRMPRGRVPLLAAALPTLVAAFGPAQAQEPAASHWEFSLTPYLWIAGVTGTLQTPNPRVPTQDVSAGFGNVLSHLNSIPIMGAAELRYGRFG